MDLDINFIGYWPISLTSVAAHPGIYCILAGTSAKTSRLLYVGETNNIEYRINRHDKWPDWKIEANNHCLYFTTFPDNNIAIREQAEAAIINHFQPPCNMYYKENFPFSTTTVKMTGPVPILNETFTVRPS